MCLGSAGERGLRCRAISRTDRCLGRIRNQLVFVVQHRDGTRFFCAVGQRLPDGRIGGAVQQRPGLSSDARFVQAKPQGPEPDGADRVLDLAGRHRAGLPRVVELPDRHGAGRRRIDLVSPTARIRLSGRRDRLGRRAHANVRRGGAGNCLQQRSGRGPAQAPGRRAGGRRSGHRGHSRGGGQQRRIGQGQFHRAERRRAGGSDPDGASARGRGAGVDQLRRGARHGDAPRGPDRGRRADAGVSRWRIAEATNFARSGR